MKSYLITDPKYYNSSKKSFSSYLEKIYKNHHIDYACFRDKKNQNKKELAEIFLEISNRYKIKNTLINSDINLAKKLGFFGVHLNSKQFDKITDAKKKDLFTLISTHSKQEAQKAQNSGADAITFSPIFQTPNKGEPKGVLKLEELSLDLWIKVFALGGILHQEQMQKCKDAGAYGFASIRYFSE